MSTESGNEFRKRAGGNVQPLRRSSASGSNSSLPRPGLGAASPVPRPSPGSSAHKRAYSNGTGTASSIPPPFPAQQRSGSFSAQGGSRSPYGAPQAAYAPSQYNGSSSANGSAGYGGYGGASGSSSNGYGNVRNNYSDGLDSDNNKYAKKPKRKGGSSQSNPAMGMIIGAVVLGVYALLMTVLYFSKSSQTSTLLTRLEQPDTLSVIKQVENLQRKLSNSEINRRNAEQNARSKFAGEINRLERENRLTKEEHNEVKNVHMPQAKDLIERHTRREEAFMNQVGWLMDRTRRESKRMVLERFGPGPHKVEISYAVSDGIDATAPKHRYQFVINLAPLEKVPHATHLFLEQVDHGLLEGTHFYLNGPHIVQSGPQPDWTQIDATDDVFHNYNEDHAKKEKVSSAAIKTIEKYEKQVAKAHTADYDDDAYEPYYTEEEYIEEDKRTKKFADLGLDQLAFPDYNEEVPHVAWTVGYTGRPGGPDWYINKVDNTEGHGPGGQYQYALNEQGDSCFGTISTEGTGRADLVQNIYHAGTYKDDSEWHHFIANPIEIVEAKILTKEPILDRHIHLDHLHSQHKVYNHRGHRNHGQQRPDTTVENMNGMGNNDHIPEHVQRMMNEGATVNKLPHNYNQHQNHGGRRPKIDGAAEA